MILDKFFLKYEGGKRRVKLTPLPGKTTLKKPSLIMVKDTPRENTPSNKTEALIKSMNMYICLIVILDQLFIRDSYTSIKFSKN